MKNIIRTFFITGLVTITGAVAGCTAMTSSTGTSTSSTEFSSASSASSSAQDTNVIVSMDEHGFQMTTATIRKGSTVTWINDGVTTQSIVGDDGGPDSDDIPAGEDYSFTFNTIGTYTYHSGVNPELVGVVIVTE